MKEFPIIFSTQMVQANLKGQRTMTRRLKGLDKINKNPDGFYFQSLVLHITGRYTFVPQGNYFPTESDVIHVKPPYNRGDLLWVRETVRLGAWREDGRMAFDYKASPELVNTPWVRFEDDHDGKKFENLHIRVCDELNKKGFTTDRDGNYHWAPGKSPLKWMPSIHMPKAAARIWLQVQEVRIERLLNINTSDAICEGIKSKKIDTFLDGTIVMFKNYFVDGEWFLNPIESFKSLWQSIHGQQSWDANPWVWIISYEVISTTGKPDLSQPAKD